MAAILLTANIKYKYIKGSFLKISEYILFKIKRVFKLKRKAKSCLMALPIHSN